MRLRTSKALKYFAILLFSFEMIAPALIAGNGEATATCDSRETTFTNAGHLTNFISSLLFEENSGEEEERESKDHKTPFYFTDFAFAQVFDLVTIETRQTAWVEPHETSATQLPLFALYHKYLI
jgi:hypothetical protein